MVKCMNSNMNFLLLWTGKFVSELGDKIYAIAMAWILEESGSPINMGLYLAFSILPGILVGVFSGAYIDRLNVKRLLIVMDAIRGIIIFFMACLYFTGNLNMWHASYLLHSFQSLLHFLRLVDKESLTKANSLFHPYYYRVYWDNGRMLTNATNTKYNINYKYNSNMIVNKEGDFMNETKTANKLINEKSPYLLQHAHNPVNWYQWSDEAFEKAKAEDKPIFLSIGYCTCH